MKGVIIMFLLNRAAKLNSVARQMLVVSLLVAGVINVLDGPVLLAAEKSDETAGNKDEADLSLIDDNEIVDLIQSKAIPKSLTDKRGNARRGEAIMIDRKKGNCLACHRISNFEDKANDNPNAYGDMGEVGPSLDGIANRYKPGQLRLLLVNAKEIFPDTIMPAFYHIKGLYRVGKSYDKKPILERQEIEDVLSFLLTLK